MIAVVVLRYQRPVRVVEPQVRVGRELVAPGVTVAVDDDFGIFGEGEVPVGFFGDCVGGCVDGDGGEDGEREQDRQRQLADGEEPVTHWSREHRSPCAWANDPVGRTDLIGMSSLPRFDCLLRFRSEVTVGVGTDNLLHHLHMVTLAATT